MYIFIYICFADAVKIFQYEIFNFFKLFFQDSSIFFQVTLKVQAFSPKLLPRSGIFFQVTSKIRPFLPSYFQQQIFSCKILQDQTFSCKIFQDTCKNNALSSKILKVKSDIFFTMGNRLGM